MERRQANDGQWYTYEGFSEHYGHAVQRQWDAAQKEAKLERSNVKPLAEEATRSRQGIQVVPVSESSVVQPHAEVSRTASAWTGADHNASQGHAKSDGTTAETTGLHGMGLGYMACQDWGTWRANAQHGHVETVSEISVVEPHAEESRGRSQEAKQCWASQLAPVSESSGVQPHAEVVGIASSSTNLRPAGDDGPPLAALPNGTTADTARTPTLPVLTITQLPNIKQKAGFGGKEANRMQRSLREQLLPKGIYEYDLTQDDWDWRQVLKALPPNVQNSVVGAGITKFRFRLLQDVMDHNYRGKIDSGERHVFHVDRVDGSAVHLHFHKNGKMDAPKVFKDVSGAVPPAAGTWEPESTTTLIGRNEAQLAFLNLLDDGAATGAVDVTD